MLVLAKEAIWTVVNTNYLWTSGQNLQWLLGPEQLHENSIWSYIEDMHIALFCLHSPGTHFCTIKSSSDFYLLSILLKSAQTCIKTYCFYQHLKFQWPLRKKRFIKYMHTDAPSKRHEQKWMCEKSELLKGDINTDLSNISSSQHQPIVIGEETNKTSNM